MATCWKNLAVIEQIYKIFLLGALIALGVSGCAALPENFDKPVSRSFVDTENTLLGKSWRDATGRAPGSSAFLLLNDGLDAFVARAVLAQVAEKSIDTQYYMIHSDHVGTLFVHELWKAAERGVRVRVLLDDIDEGDRDLNIRLFDMHPNIEVRIFNPFGRNVGRVWQYLTGFGKQTRRSHNKSFTVDSEATILGGRNIGDEYFSRNPELDFQDLDVLAMGPVAKEVSYSFDQYWNSVLSYPISALVDIPESDASIEQYRLQISQQLSQYADSAYLKRLENSNLAREIRAGMLHWEWALGTVIADPPEKLVHKVDEQQYQMISKLIPYLDKTQKELIILSPYFVPGKAGVEYLTQLRKRGVRVRILTNSLASTDVSIVHAGYARYRKQLLRAGVELHELNMHTTKEERKAVREAHLGSSKSSLHAKAFIIDRSVVFIGSMNFDPRSIKQNTEIGVVIQSPAIGEEIATAYDKNIDQVAFRLDLNIDDDGREELVWYGQQGSETIKFTYEPYTGFWRRLGVALARLLPIESQI